MLQLLIDYLITMELKIVELNVKVCNQDQS